VKFKYHLLYGSQRYRRPGPKGPSSELIAAVVETKRRNPRMGCRRVAEQISSDLEATQYEMGRRDSGTHTAGDIRAPARCARMSHRQPSGHSRSFVQDCTSVRRDAGITGLAPGHSQVADPFRHWMHVLCGSQSKSARQGLPWQAELTDETRNVAAKAADAAIAAMLCMVVLP